MQQLINLNEHKESFKGLEAFFLFMIQKNSKNYDQVLYKTVFSFTPIIIYLFNESLLYYIIL